MSARSQLAVLVDGAALPEDEARALWERFSEWMEEHRGDLEGFAKREGFASIYPDVASGRPVLRASRTAPQRPYAPAGGAKVGEGAPPGGGSNGRQGTGRRPRSKPRRSKK